MHPYVLLVAAATLISAACSGAIFLHNRDRRSSQLASLVLFGSSGWGVCQILACLSAEPDAAARWFRFSAFGWAFIGPMALHTFMDAMGDERPAIRRARTVIYGVSAGILLLALGTDRVVAGALPVTWGHWMVVGPLYPLAHLNNTLGIALGGAVVLRAIGRLSDGERRQMPVVAVSAAVPFTVTTVTDSVLPTIGVVFPPLGTASLAVLAMLAVWVVVHYGYSMLTPGPFATEILALLPDGVAVLRPDERIRSANEGLARLSGRNVADLEDRPIGELLSWSFESEEFDEVDCELVGSTGRRVPVSVSASALRDRQGNSLGRVLIVRDLREVADLRRRLVVSARLAAVGELAAGIAHEINNPLAFVRSNLSQFEGLWKAVKSELEDADRTARLHEEITDIDELVSESLEGVDRAAEIVRGVKSFAHAGSPRRELADLNLLLDDVVRVASPQLRGRAEVETDYAEIPAILCSVQQIRQVFLNLVLNASQALQGLGTIRLTTRPIDGGVAVTVEDDGSGIPAEIIDRIFDPFFTTKPVGEGTGLGLGIAYQILEQHRGTISVASRPGSGTKFRVQLPCE